MITLTSHPLACGARQAGQGLNAWLLFDRTGNTVDVISGEELIDLVKADDDAERGE